MASHFPRGVFWISCSEAGVGQCRLNMPLQVLPREKRYSPLTVQMDASALVYFMMFM